MIRFWSSPTYLTSRINKYKELHDDNRIYNFLIIKSRHYYTKLSLLGGLNLDNTGFMNSLLCIFFPFGGKKEKEML